MILFVPFNINIYINYVLAVWCLFKMWVKLYFFAFLRLQYSSNEALVDHLFTPPLELMTRHVTLFVSSIPRKP